MTEYSEALRALNEAAWTAMKALRNAPRGDKTAAAHRLKMRNILRVTDNLVDSL